jgi:LPS sulfotransferase NodH
MFYYFQYLRTYLIIQQKRWMNKLSFSKTLSYSPFVILSEPRSGSTLLHTYLNSHTQVKSYGEVLRENLVDAPHLPLTESSVSQLVFKPHTPALKAIGLKIFYEYYDDPLYAAAFQHIVQRKDVKIIHLVRQDLLKVYASLQVARKTNIWSSTKSNAAEKVKVLIDVDDFKRFVLQHRTHQEKFASLFKDHSCIKISYEELVGKPEATLEMVQQFLGVPARKLFSLLKKQNSDTISSIVENYDEVVQVIEDNELS